MSATRLSSLRRLSTDTLGFAAVAATLALAWPGGVQTARADEAALMSVDPSLVEAQKAPAREADEKVVKLVLPSDPGPSCANPGVGSTLDNAMIEHQAKQMLRQIAKRAQDAPPGQPWIAETDQGIVLNSRGYNYRPYRQDQPEPTP